VADDPPTSLTLLDRARSSDSQAWSRLVYLYEPLVRHWCARWGFSGPDADDLVQETFVALSTGLAGFRREQPGQSFRAWLRGVARNKRIDALRRRHRDPAGQGGTEAHRRLGEIADPETDEPDPGEQLSALYHRALDLVRGEFEDRTWRVFWRVAVDGQSVDTVAGEFGISQAGVRQAKSRVLRRLKEEVGDLIA
jgi:RNA polymerase sigma-70 factor (ECF subfamily)